MELELTEYKFCNICGGKVDIVLHEGRCRPVCVSCGHVVYINPVPAVCQVVLDEKKILLVLRAVEPRKGMWCLPGGFIEWGEKAPEGSKRELFEETALKAAELSLIGVYDSITDSNKHVLLIAHRVHSWSGDPVAGDDAERAEWFGIAELPPIAFSSHERVIQDVLENEGIN
ncbi:NUDIX hydrolase [Candidatus Latescibacterota bacterium]